MNASWRRDEWKDKLTGELLGVEVLPVNDERRHKEGEDADECDCLPSLKMQNGVPLLVHNSFDGRELSEPDCRERGN